jgi:hypothetical protein
MHSSAPEETNPVAATTPDLPATAELRAQIKDGRVFDLIDRRLRHDADAPLVQAFVEALDDPTLSLLAVLSTPAFEALSGFRFWEIQRFLTVVIPKLGRTDPVDMSHAVERLVRQGGQDGAAGMPFTALRAWFQADVSRAADLVARVRASDAEVSGASLAHALVALDDTALAMQLMSSPETREAAVRALSELPHQTHAERTELVEALRTHVADVEDDGLKGLALDVIVQVHNTAEATLDANALALAAELLEDAGDVTLYRAAMLPFAHRKAMSSELVAALLRTLQAVKPEHGGTLDMLDHALTTLSEDPRFSDAATQFVTTVINRPAPRLSLNAFDSWFRALIVGPPERFHAVLIDWLLNGSAEALAEVAHSLPLDDLRGISLEVDFSRLGLSEPERLIVCRRGVSWFFVHPITAASLAVSGLRSAGPELAAALSELIYDPLLVNYGGAAYAYLSAIAESDPAHPHAAPLLARADNHLENLRLTGVLPELHPSEHERFLEQSRYADEMSKAMKAAEHKSVFANLFPKLLLLYGRTAVASFRTTDGQDSHQEIAMQSISASHELPRREIVDPIGLDWQLRSLKTTRLKR